MLREASRALYKGEAAATRAGQVRHVGPGVGPQE